MTTWVVCSRAVQASGDRFWKTEYQIFTAVQLERDHPGWELASGACSSRKEAIAELEKRLAEDSAGVQGDAASRRRG